MLCLLTRKPRHREVGNLHTQWPGWGPAARLRGLSSLLSLDELGGMERPTPGAPCGSCPDTVPRGAHSIRLCPIFFSPPSSSRNLLHASQLIVGAQDLLSVPLLLQTSPLQYPAPYTLEGGMRRVLFPLFFAR